MSNRGRDEAVNASVVGRRIVRATGCLLVITAAVLLPPARGEAQTVRGVVTDEASGAPIALATVRLVSSSGETISTTLTSDEGFFSVGGDGGGRYLVRASALGYTPDRAGPLDLGSDQLLVVELRMRAAPLPIDSLVVEGSRAGEGDALARRGFWARYEEGRGSFLTPGEVLASDAMFTPHLLRGLDRVVPQHGAPPWSVWPLLGVVESKACEPRVYVDDMWVNRPDFGIRASLGLDDVVPIDRVEAVEVYHGPFQAPLRYQGTSHDNSCGVILFWTR